MDDVPLTKQYLTFPLDLSSLSKHPQPELVWDQIHKGLAELLSIPSGVNPDTNKNLARPLLYLIIALLLLFGGYLVYDHFFNEAPPDDELPPIIIEMIHPTSIYFIR